MSSPDLNNNRDPKAKKPKLQNKQDTKKIWGAKSVSPEVKEGPKVTSIPRAQPTMMTKVPSTAFNLPKPANAPIASTSSAAKQPQQYHSVKPAPQQKVQIIRSSDGKMQVQGLLPCQQVVHLPPTFSWWCWVSLGLDSPLRREGTVGRCAAPRHSC